MFPQFGRKKGSLVGAESNIKVMRDSLIVFVVQTPERLMCLWKLPGAGFVQHKHSSGETILVEGTMTFTLVRFGSQQMSRLFASQTSELSSDACSVFNKSYLGEIMLDSILLNRNLYPLIENMFGMSKRFFI